MTQKVEFEQAFITPELAKELLRTNDGNRKIRETTVTYYIDQMRRGQWKEDTGEPIKISPAGRVLDGQHRLLAIIGYGQGFNFHIARNIPEENFQVLDTGLKRSASDSLHALGIPNDIAIAGAIKNWAILGTKSTTGKRSNTSVLITIEDIIKEYNLRPDFWQKIARDGTLLYRKFNNIISPTILMGWYAIFSDINTVKAEQFMEKLCLGMNITHEKDVVNQLRNILQKNHLNRLKMSLYARSGHIVKAWNYFLRDREVNLLRFDEMKDDFPLLDTGKEELLADNGTKKVRGAYKKKNEENVNFIELP